MFSSSSSPPPSSMLSLIPVSSLRPSVCFTLCLPLCLSTSPLYNQIVLSPNLLLCYGFICLDIFGFNESLDVALSGSVRFA